MPFQLRAATPDDLLTILPRTRALCAQEGIVISDDALEVALRRLLDEPSLGGVWLVLEGPTPIGYAIVTFGYDLEYGGRDAYLTELWIDEALRSRGAGRTALDLLDGELRKHDVRALHLQVRPDNPAVRLYERAGFETSRRVVMTRRLVRSA